MPAVGSTDREHYLPVVARVAGDNQGSIFNVNGDQMAVACAKSFGVDKLIFLTDVEGVRDGSGKTCHQLTITEALALIANGAATGEMQAKIESAVSALRQNVGEVALRRACNRELSRQFSKSSGWNPTCAGQYGRPDPTRLTFF